MTIKFVKTQFFDNSLFLFCPFTQNKCNIIKMGCSESKPTQVVDHQGKVVMNRKCICLLCPPSFETSKFIDLKPAQLQYRFISVGKLIRDQINKRTHYSKIIMENLAKHKKINENILQVLLKNIALQGNFIIQFCPKDSDDLFIWKRFLKQVDVDLIVIISPDHKADAGQQKLVFQEKMKNYYRDIKHIKDMFPPNAIKQFENDGEIWGNIVKELNHKPRAVQPDQQQQR